MSESSKTLKTLKELKEQGLIADGREGDVNAYIAQLEAEQTTQEHDAQIQEALEKAAKYDAMQNSQTLKQALEGLPITPEKFQEDLGKHGDISHEAMVAFAGVLQDFAKATGQHVATVNQEQLSAAEQSIQERWGMNIEPGPVSGDQPIKTLAEVEEAEQIALDEAIMNGDERTVDRIEQARMQRRSKNDPAVAQVAQLPVQPQPPEAAKTVPAAVGGPTG